MIRHFALLLWSLPLLAQSGGEMRVFTDAKGRTIKARLVGVANGQVTIQREDGQQFPIPLATLSAADQEYVKQNATATAGGGKAGANDKGHSAGVECARWPRLLQ